MAWQLECVGTTLVGEVEGVTFENEETGFRVLRLCSVEGVEGKKRMTAVGVVPAVGPGTRVRISGRIETDPKHGERIRMESLVTLAPDSLEGVERYLSSGVIAGIGPGFAKRIVKYFGLETLAVLDSAPHRLGEVPGLGAGRVEQIRKSWVEHHALSNVLLSLASHGVSPALATRIVKRFGEKAAEVVQNNPYRLAIEVPGVGFKTADRIARSQGLSSDHPERARAGVLHELRTYSDSGHCVCDRAFLVQASAAMLGVDAAHVEAAIDALWASEWLVVEESDVYLTRLHLAEVRVADRIARLLKAPTHHLPRFEDSIARFEKERGIVLAAGQRAAVEAAAKEKLVIITGGPGVGKTTIVQGILAVLEEEKLRTGLAAPTGRAAKRLSESTGRSASTLHRLLEVNALTGRFERTAERPLELDLLIVDEASMIDVRLAESLLDALPDAARLVLVGDSDQLPSVGPGAVLSDLIASRAIPVARLDVVFRQAGHSNIIENAHRILAGEPPSSDNEPGSDFFLVSAKSADRAAELVVQAVTERIPERFGLDPRRDIQVLTPMHRGAAGTIALNHRLQSVLNPTGPSVLVGESRLRVGDKVLQLKNDYDREVFNGDVGEVVRVDADEGQIHVVFDDDQGRRAVEYRKNQFSQLCLAYAMSIHKSQGSEYPAVVIPFLTAHYIMLSRNLLYTAVTRGKKLCVLLADPRAVKVALAEVRREQRHTRLSQRVSSRARGIN